MANALNIFQGDFGRVALLHMDHSLVVHAHPHCHVLIKLSGADGAFNVRGTTCPLTDESLVLVNAWEPHSYLHQAPDDGTVILALYIQPEWLAAFALILARSGRPDFFAAPVGWIAPRVRTAANTLAEAIRGDSSDEDRLERVVMLMMAIAEEFSACKHKIPSAPPGCMRPSDYRIRKALAFLHDNVGTCFTLREVARQSGLSRSHMFHLFQSDLKISPNLYFNALRVEAAIDRLAQGQEPLADLSESLGFSMQSHFTRFFRNNIGINPSEYRRVVSFSQNFS